MNKILSALGLANKAGALAVGTNNVLAAIKSGKARLVVISSDASENTVKLISDKAGYRGIEVLSLTFSMNEIARALGRQRTSAVAITDDNLLAAFNKQLKADKTAIRQIETEMHH
ncbi:MAG: L7Ae/L30e/S12e/Gadd45 family ribosomal protein [Eubacteriales bacterium]|nr:L7Ae/L30e/S12e/Gadd45 family ribosomal protein [Eubacteriales bacterium]MDD4421676.1 L7Ae/L30e/S12e/Gadd45 family ribosomal protein [Eubacteriales bacterium]HBR31285.1 hypothetical protein [Clostridiales bacterium]